MKLDESTLDKSAQIAKTRILSGIPAQQAVKGLHARQTQRQSAGWPAVYKFHDGSILEIFGRGMYREVRVKP